ncbi:Water Stress and Hypersensitive response domain-containing protein [Methanocaldococcus villosus KIN24-T80]|uniref:Water Stress and Hypersensitive response domain-containing protein n=1 Tax=Methanocaldococcus villosus KIN24-T80 TaxID=1069083 RepID=N6UWD3_9EURY|nr:LEA type 2 family protein [Methanocaldococcus villosus]ENN96619.1 Water Stress and Hypersensitive response domain-containing protein [Methanocaldococcus villosus KIN24-T80]
MRRLLILLIVLPFLMTSGCLEKPKIVSNDIEFKKVEADTTLLNVKITVENPNPIGVHINKIFFNIFYINNDGKLEYLGYGEKEDININSGNTTIEIPVHVLNKNLAKALIESGGVLRVKIDGKINVDLFLTSIDVPISYETTLNIPEYVKEELKEMIANLL